jgi:hypothetical protein
VKALAALVLLAALARCGGDAPPPGEGDLLGGPVPSDAALQQQACEKRGGRWGAGGLGKFNLCYETTHDGGKACSKAGDCEGLCLARSRTCAPVTPLFGCNDILDRLGRSQALCID